MPRLFPSVPSTPSASDTITRRLALPIRQLVLLVVATRRKVDPRCHKTCLEIARPLFNRPQRGLCDVDSPLIRYDLSH